ncbi:tetratricopeptide repeat protein [Rubrivivax gelatinosus]|uniref:Tetratricopeptide repeat protein n=1 Tax=Rubrivivax gelatinosus TaxID=28068 RepID=A0A4V2SGM9_RUBGE|nr:tetratricopeptide repeat protein [Rubrivivax gelatinosus]MBK1688440.1 hypothetical protein [Rubrivivax gelatinosus]TCP01828.1 tetratricopeptide repeat protein [Rubrivivax gelatinosus]
MADAPTPRQRADALVERSRALAAIGRWKDAEAQARRAAAEDPSHTRARLQLAYVLAQLGRADEAVELARGVLAQEPGSAWAMRLLANADSLRGRHAEAVEMARQAVRASDGDALSRLLLSTVHQRAGDLIGARVEAEALVAAFPDWADGFVRLAQTRHSPEEAVQAYREALRLDPENDDALAGLAGQSRAMARYRDAVALAWSALRADVGDRGRQRLFARSAWRWLMLSRIASPTRGAARALADTFGEPCARAFQATGAHAAARLWFAFRVEAIAVTAWLALLAAIGVATLLPDAVSEVVVPLLALPVFIGLAVPFFVFFGFIAAARRQLDARLQRLGRPLSWLARAAVSGVLLMALSIAALLAWPDAAGWWTWPLLVAIVLTVQDLVRWRDAWRDTRPTTVPGQTRRALARWADARARRWLTPPRLAAFVAAAGAAEMAVDRWAAPAGAAAPGVPAMAWVGALALACWGGERLARWRTAAAGAAPRGAHWHELGRTLMALAWTAAAFTALGVLGGRVVAGHPVEALWPVLLLVPMVGGAWLVYSVVRLLLRLAAGATAEGLRGLWRRGARRP